MAEREIVRTLTLKKPPTWIIEQEMMQYSSLERIPSATLLILRLNWYQIMLLQL